MHLKSASFLAAGLAAQRALAGGWTDASAFSCPSNTNNHCTPQQQGGYDWSGLSTGSFSSYGSNKFSGFTCSDSFGKRDVLNKRDFQSKCITGNLDDQPSMSGDAFSINQMQISSSHDAEIEAHYGMPDGSTCKEVHSCSRQGTTFQNTQCGGATQVTFKPGKGAPKGCSIGVHSVGFHCGSPSAPPTSPSTSVSVESSPPSSPPVYTTPPVYHTSSTPIVPVSSSPPAPPCYGKDCSTPVPTSSAPKPPCYGHDCSTSVAPISSSAPAPPCYGDSCTSSSPPSPPCYGPQCSPSSTPVSPVSSSTPAPPPCYGKDCSTTPVAPASSSPPAPYSPLAPYSSSPAAPVSSSPAPPSYQPPPPPQCPEVLPRCLKTWMFVTSCKDNADQSCFCENGDLIKNVMSCLSAWGASQSEVQAAVSYLTGLCAASVPNNPAIITACPPGITPAPTPVASMPAPTAPPAGPIPPCTTITYSSSTVTVPVVSFTTSTITVEGGSTTCSVGLGAPTPSGAPAYTTPAPYPSGAPPASAGAGTTFGTSWGTSWAPSASSGPVLPPTNAGAKAGSGIVGLAFSGLIMLLAL